MFMGTLQPLFLLHDAYECRIVRCIRPLPPNHTSVPGEQHYGDSPGAHNAKTTSKVLIAAKVEYVRTAYHNRGLESDFSGDWSTAGIVVSHTCNSSDGGEALSKPYLMVFPTTQGLVEDSSHIVLTIYSVQNLFIGDRVAKYVMKKKVIKELDRKLTMDIDMDGHSHLIDDKDVWQTFRESSVGLDIRRIFIDSMGCGAFKDSERWNEREDGWPLIVCGEDIIMRRHDGSGSIYSAKGERARWFQHKAVVIVLCVTILYFYSRAVVWLYTWSRRDSQRSEDGGKSTSSKGWVRDDQQGRLFRA